jgi:hypothetical protein
VVSMLTITGSSCNVVCRTLCDAAISAPTEQLPNQARQTIFSKIHYCMFLCKTPVCDPYGTQIKDTNL